MQHEFAQKLWVMEPLCREETSNFPGLETFSEKNVLIVNLFFLVLSGSFMVINHWKLLHLSIVMQIACGDFKDADCHHLLYRSSFHKLQSSSLLKCKAVAIFMFFLGQGHVHDCCNLHLATRVSKGSLNNWKAPRVKI